MDYARFLELLYLLIVSKITVLWCFQVQVQEGLQSETQSCAHKQKPKT